jgi:hypothetical protein
LFVDVLVFLVYKEQIHHAAQKRLYKLITTTF